MDAIHNFISQGNTYVRVYSHGGITGVEPAANLEFTKFLFAPVSIKKFKSLPFPPAQVRYGILETLVDCIKCKMLEGRLP